ncbi:MAG: nucleotidyltransferase domain-containing protein [Saprospiraceae bacterium]|nr:nucleotidyltransferase domain-containing protein [Saprospiraceae bacterium]
MKEQILTELHHLENQHAIKILYAVESGSRAWGFASTDSDWDVRFIYVHRKDWYLSIDDKKDSIEIMLPDDLDLSGWELRKALKLFRKSNPPLYEWLNSPIVYLEEKNTLERLRNLSTEYFNPKSCLYHYLHMAEGNFKNYLQKDLVRTKKYFYALRPVLACRWIERTNTMPPTEFQHLLDSEMEDGPLKNEIINLLIRKISGEEIGEEPKIDLIHAYLAEQIQYYRDYLTQFNLKKQPDTEQLNMFFRDTLKAFGNT